MTSPWTEEMNADLKALRQEGRSFTEIADRLKAKYPEKKFTRNACLGRADRMGLPKEKATPRKRVLVKTETGESKRVPLKKVRLLKAPPLVPPKQVDPHNLTLMELERHHCRYIVTADDEEARFCGLPVVEGSSYCQYHHSICKHTMKTTRFYKRKVEE